MYYLPIIYEELGPHGSLLVASSTNISRSDRFSANYFTLLPSYFTKSVALNPSIYVRFQSCNRKLEDKFRESAATSGWK